jgi:hypothetical protein
MESAMVHGIPTKEELHEEAMATKSTETRPLWCIAAEEWNFRKREWTLELRYNHSTCEAEARVTYLNARALEQRPVRIVAAAQVIGYHVNDNQGDQLSA